MTHQEKYCNMCGKKIAETGLDREDSVTIIKKWGYFSGKDEEQHTICLCEKCYDSWIKSFRIPPHVEEVTELLS